MKYLLLLATCFYVGSAFALKPSNVILFNAQANTTGEKDSLTMDAQFISSGSIQGAFSDIAAAGDLILQCSNDTVKPTHWSTCVNGSNTGKVTVSAGALTLISLEWINSRWLRVSWTRSAGAGTLSVTGQFQGY